MTWFPVAVVVTTVRVLHGAVLTWCLVAVVVTTVRVLHGAVLTWFAAAVVNGKSYKVGL